MLKISVCQIMDCHTSFAMTKNQSVCHCVIARNEQSERRSNL
ncbi:hypothetical protein [Helicobacter rodentium]|nr:hypothetical protein [Helicobacter rodentium]